MPKMSIFFAEFHLFSYEILRERFIVKFFKNDFFPNFESKTGKPVGKKYTVFRRLLSMQSKMMDQQDLYHKILFYIEK